MNRKADFFSVLLVVTFAVAMIIAFIAAFRLSDELGKDPLSRIGVKQAIILDTKMQENQMQLYAREAAIQSYPEALLNAGKHGFIDEPACGTWYGSWMWNNENTECPPSQENMLKELEYDVEDRTANILPADYQTVFKEKEIIGISRIPMILGFQDKTTEGQYSYPQYTGGPLLFPVENPYVTSCFGYRGEIKEGTSNHAAVDFRAALGTAVKAAATGIIETVDQRWGRIVILHDSPTGTIRTEYVHLSSFAPGITKGMTVSAAQVIGYAGNKGCADKGCASHLHFGIIDQSATASMQGIPGASIFGFGAQHVNPLCYFDTLPDSAINYQSQSCKDGEQKAYDFCQYKTGNTVQPLAMQIPPSQRSMEGNLTFTPAFAIPHTEDISFVDELNNWARETRLQCKNGIDDCLTDRMDQYNQQHPKEKLDKNCNIQINEYTINEVTARILTEITDEISSCAKLSDVQCSCEVQIANRLTQDWEMTIDIQQGSISLFVPDMSTPNFPFDKKIKYGDPARTALEEVKKITFRAKTQNSKASMVINANQEITKELPETLALYKGLNGELILSSQNTHTHPCGRTAFPVALCLDTGKEINKYQELTNQPGELIPTPLRVDFGITLTDTTPIINGPVTITEITDGKYLVSIDLTEVPREINVFISPGPAQKTDQATQINIDWKWLYQDIQRPTCSQDTNTVIGQCEAEIMVEGLPTKTNFIAESGLIGNTKAYVLLSLAPGTFISINPVDVAGNTDTVFNAIEVPS
jgi:murein DD-endopeptidase MepM/ murein hydrolase activator NlpD